MNDQALRGALCLLSSLLWLGCNDAPSSSQPKPDMAQVQGADLGQDMPQMLPFEAPVRPGVDELPPQAQPPALLVDEDGQPVRTVTEWEQRRRPQLEALLSYYIYGYGPRAPITVSAKTLTVIDGLKPGLVSYQELELSLGELPDKLHVSLFYPADRPGPFPVFIAPNKCGNQEALTDERVRATTAWADLAGCGSVPEDNRGRRASNWPIEQIISRGYAFATFHESELDPDDPRDRTFSDGVHPHLLSDDYPEPLRWGRIKAWAWGISRVVDALMSHELIDATKIAAVGHSRRGKTALLAGAFDPRISMVIAHQSGTAGTAMTRSMEGESLKAINTIFPSWFNDVFPTFNQEPLKLPVDQHMLIALVAPRLMLATDGADDAWADPAGSRQAVELANEAWRLYDAPGIIPEADGSPSLKGRLSWRLRPGEHELMASDWEIFLAFADQHWGQ